MSFIVMTKFSKNEPIHYIWIFLPGIVISILAINLLSREISSYSWKKTNATVDDVYLVEHEDPDDYSIHYQTYIRFKYTINGSQYNENKPIKKSNVKIGDIIQIYYDPSNPESVQLYKGISLHTLGFLFIGIAWIGIFIFLNILSERIHGNR